MLRDCPCSTKTREVLGNPSPLPSRFPSTLEISLGLRLREISWVSGNLLAVGDGFPNPSLVLVEHGYNGHQTSLHGLEMMGPSSCQKSFSDPLPVEKLMLRDCIRAPPRRGRYWEIHPQFPIPPSSWWSTDTMYDSNLNLP